MKVVEEDFCVEEGENELEGTEDSEKGMYLDEGEKVERAG